MHKNILFMACVLIMVYFAQLNANAAHGVSDTGPTAEGLPESTVTLDFIIPEKTILCVAQNTEDHSCSIGLGDTSINTLGANYLAGFDSVLLHNEGVLAADIMPNPGHDGYSMYTAASIYTNADNKQLKLTHLDGSPLGTVATLTRANGTETITAEFRFGSSGEFSDRLITLNNPDDVVNLPIGQIDNNKFRLWVNVPKEIESYRPGTYEVSFKIVVVSN